MKNFLLSIIVLIGLNMNAQGVFFLHGINVPQENASIFEQRETQYLSELAQDEVDADRMAAWILLKRVNSIGNPSDYKYNYIWVHRFKDIKQMVERKPFWQNMESEFGDISNFIWGDIGATESGRYYWKVEGEIPSEKVSKFVILNGAKPTDIEKLIKTSTEIANKVFKKNMKKSGIKSWGVASKIIPINSNTNPNTILFWDGYDNMEGIMGHLANEAAMSDIPEDMKKEVFSYIPDGWGWRSVWQIIASTSIKQ